MIKYGVPYQSIKQEEPKWVKKKRKEDKQKGNKLKKASKDEPCPDISKSLNGCRK